MKDSGDLVFMGTQESVKWGTHPDYRFYSTGLIEIFIEVPLFDLHRAIFYCELDMSKHLP